MPAARRLRLDPNGGPPRIGRDGTITQNNRQIGAIGLFKIDRQAELRRFDNSGVIPDRPATPVVDFSQGRRAAGLHRARQRQSGAGDDQAHHGLRAFEAVSSSLKDSESSLQEAISTLGATS